MDNQKLKTELNNIQDLEKYVGKEIGITDWFQITQDDINSFMAEHKLQGDWISAAKHKEIWTTLENCYVQDRWR